MFTYKPTVLIVEDESTASLMERFIRSVGVNTINVRGVEAAVAYLSKQPADLVVTDFAAPEADLAILAQAMRENFAWSDVPVVMLCEDDSIALRWVAAEAGVHAVLPKPFTRAQLTDAVVRILRDAPPPPPAPSGAALDVPVDGVVPLHPVADAPVEELLYAVA